MEEPSVWIRIVENLGLPTALLLVGLFFVYRLNTRWVVPWIKQLVDSHVAFVKAMQQAHKDCNAGHDKIFEAIDALTRQVSELTKEVARLKGGRS